MNIITRFDMKFPPSTDIKRIRKSIDVTQTCLAK